MIELVKGFPVALDGRVRGEFNNNPSTGRLAMHSPNLMTLPRGNDSDVQTWVKQMFVCPPGAIFWERDFSAIEAVLVGYFAGSPNYIRFAKLGVHAYLASHIISRPVDLAWSDTDIRRYFKELKGQEAAIYDIAKRIVHGSNYMMTPRKMSYEYPEQFPTIKSAAKLQDLYFELFPEIRTWHKELCLRVDGTKQRKRGEVSEIVDPWTLGVAYAQNPFGYIHRFYNVLDWENVNGEWIWSYGSDAKRLVAFLPQSTAACILKRAVRSMWYDYPWVGETLRLLIHDSVLGEAKEEMLDKCLEISKLVMEAPIKELPLDSAWGQGEFLTISSEAKWGKSWGEMH